jgi:hypothetical protein
MCATIQTWNIWRRVLITAMMWYLGDCDHQVNYISVKHCSLYGISSNYWKRSVGGSTGGRWYKITRWQLITCHHFLNISLHVAMRRDSRNSWLRMCGNVTLWCQLCTPSLDNGLIKAVTCNICTNVQKCVQFTGKCPQLVLVKQKCYTVMYRDLLSYNLKSIYELI